MFKNTLTGFMSDAKAVKNSIVEKTAKATNKVAEKYGEHSIKSFEGSVKNLLRDGITVAQLNSIISNAKQIIEAENKLNSLKAGQKPVQQNPAD